MAMLLVTAKLPLPPNQSVLKVDVQRAVAVALG